MAGFKDLPHELKMDILLRLPVKTLVRFTCLAKSWRSFITNPKFAAVYLQRGGSNADSSLICVPQLFSNRRLCTVIHDQTISNVKLPFKTHSGYYHIVGSCNGLLCLSAGHWDQFSEYLYLWNPSVRKLKIIQCPLLECDEDDDEEEVEEVEIITMLGFGFDHRNNDFLVIRSIFYYGFDEASYTEVYSLNADSWRRVRAVLPRLPETVSLRAPWRGLELPSQPCNKSTVFFNGVVHWNASPMGTDRDGTFYSIVSFDIAKIQFRMIKLPGDCFGCCAERGLLPDFWTPAVFKESLAFIVLGRAEDWSKVVCYIWVMEEYGVVESWTKRFTVNFEDTIIRSFGFTKDGELLLDDGGVLRSYNFDRDHYSDLGFCRNSYDVSTFMESLCLVGEKMQTQNRLKRRR